MSKLKLRCCTLQWQHMKFRLFENLILRNVRANLTLKTPEIRLLLKKFVVDQPCLTKESLWTGLSSQFVDLLWQNAELLLILVTISSFDKDFAQIWKIQFLHRFPTKRNTSKLKLCGWILQWQHVKFRLFESLILRNVRAYLTLKNAQFACYQRKFVKTQNWKCAGVPCNENTWNSSCCDAWFWKNAGVRTLKTR